MPYIVAGVPPQAPWIELLTWKDETTRTGRDRFGEGMGVSGMDLFHPEDDTSGAVSPSACGAQTERSVEGAQCPCVELPRPGEVAHPVYWDVRARPATRSRHRECAPRCRPPWRQWRRIRELRRTVGH